MELITPYFLCLNGYEKINEYLGIGFYSQYRLIDEKELTLTLKTSIVLTWNAIMIVL